MRTWLGTVDRVLVGAAACLLLTELVGVIGALPGASDSATPWLLALSLVNVVLVGLCVRALTVGSVQGVSTLAAVVAALGLMAAGLAVAEGVPEYARQLLPSNAVQALQVIAIALITRTVAAVLVVVATGPAFVLMYARVTDATVVEALDLWVLPASGSICIIILLATLRRGAALADALAVSVRDDAADAESASLTDAAAEEARRLVHDEVISALRAVELELSQDVVRRNAARALDRIDQSAGRADPTAHDRCWHDDLIGSAPVAVVQEGQWATEPPLRVRHAFAAAAAEALRNVDRHAAVDTAVLRLRNLQHQWVLEVVDDGVGFDGTRPGFGISRSIVARMSSVGGLADVASEPGRGTTVTLSWPAAVATTARGRLDLEVDRRKGFGLVAAVSLVANLYVAFRFPGPDAVTGIAVALLCAGVLAMLAVHLGRGPGDGRLLALTTVTACGLVWLGLLAADDASLLSLRSWVVGFAAMPIALASFDCRLWWGLAAAGAETVTALSFAVADPAIGPFDPLGALLTPLVVVGITAGVGAGMRQGQRAITRSEAVLAAHADDRAWRAAADVAHRAHLAHVEADVVPFLTRVRDGATISDSDREDARLLGQLCRDDLYLERPIPDVTRQHVRLARERGVVVTIRTNQARLPFPASTWPALELMLQAARPGHVVTAIPPRTAAGPARLVAVPVLSSDALPTAVTDRVRTTLLVSADEATAEATPERV